MYGAKFQRVEEKYLLTKKEKAAFLKMTKSHLEKDKYFYSEIHNIYFDTKNNDLIINSLEKPVFKDKFRIRSYNKPTLEDDIFFEMKTKYKGLEAETIVINAETINLVASDDGINAAGGADSSANNRPNHQETYSKSSLTINGGTIIVSGPTSNGDGALDYDETFEITAGELLAYESSGMAQGISNTSTQYGFLINLSTTYQSSSKITLVDSDDNEIFTHTTNKSFSSVAYSSPKLQEGGTYTLKINDKVIESFTLNNISSTYGNSNRFGRR